MPENEAFVHLEVAQRVPYQRVIDAETYFNRLIHAVGRSVVGRDDPWQFVTAETNGVVRLRVTPIVAEEHAEQAVQIVDAIVSGVADLEQGAVRPAFFSDVALEFARDLALLSGELREVGIRNGRFGSPVTQNVADHASALLAPEFEEFGSVEGTVEVVNFHSKSRYFNLYDALDGHRIRCNFGDRVDPDDIRDALLRRVLVTGMIGYRSAGIATEVRVESVRVFPDEDRLPTPTQVRGILG